MYTIIQVGTVVRQLSASLLLEVTKCGTAGLVSQRRKNHALQCHILLKILLFTPMVLQSIWTGCYDRGLVMMRVSGLAAGDTACKSKAG
jgi:hypothetical protein